MVMVLLQITWRYRDGDALSELTEKHKGNITLFSNSLNCSHKPS
jgi:hypothetical protein